MIIELSMCEADRTALGGPEWVQLDTDRLLDTPGGKLMRWETEAGYSIERALGQVLSGGNPPAAAVLVMLWLARKQGGVDAGGIVEATGQPESFSRLAEQVRTLKVSIRRAEAAEPDPEMEGDAVPPALTPEP